jgi:hypothetical protein
MTKLFLIVFASFVLSYRCVPQSPSDAFREHCEKVTGAIWPPRTTDIDFTDGIFNPYIAGHFRIPFHAVDAFAVSNAFVRIGSGSASSRGQWATTNVWWLQGLQPTNRILPDTSALLERETDATERFRWWMLMDETTGRVWVFMSTPDFAGD